jgi:hypothetical protein
MLRIIGILTGAALACAILILALGVPELEKGSDHISSIEEGSDHISSMGEEALPDSTADVAEQETGSDPIIAAEQEMGSDPIKAEEEMWSDPISDPDLGFGGWQPEPETVAAVVPEPIEENWYAFWSPFRSEIAANGFVSRLQETTGLDYRVVKVKTGVYEVAFAYTDDADIEDKLARISTATGLDMSGG